MNRDELKGWDIDSQTASFTSVGADALGLVLRTAFKKMEFRAKSFRDSQVITLVLMKGYDSTVKNGE